jgi:hypothetical protein
MFQLPTHAYFLEWQLYHYAKRVAEERNPKALEFLKTQLNNLKK